MSTMLMDEPQLAVEPRQTAFEEQVLLLAPSFGWWRGQYQLPSADTSVTLADRVVDKDDVSSPRSKLMNDKYPLDANGKPWKARFQAIESCQKSLVIESSVAFAIRGVRIIPRKKGKEFFERLYGPTVGELRRRLQHLREQDGDGNFQSRQLEQRLANAQRGYATTDTTPVWNPDKSPEEQSVAYQLHQAAYEFCEDLDGIYRQIRDRVGATMWDSVHKKLPAAPGKMREKFYLDVTPIELAGGGRPKEVTMAAVEEYNDVVREACRRRVEEAIDSMIQEPRQQLADALTSLQELVARQGRVTSKSFNPVRDAIAKIRLFDFVANDDLLAKINELDAGMGRVNPGELTSNSAAAAGFNAALGSVLTEVNNAVTAAHVNERFGRNYRSIDI